MVRKVIHFNSQCAPELQVIDSISGKWTVMVVHILSDKPFRNGEIKKAINGISHKMLTQTLRRLERDGLLTRKVYPVVPPQVEYSLTPLGKTLVELLSNLSIWSIKHYSDVIKAREKYDKASTNSLRNKK